MESGFREGVEAITTEIGLQWEVETIGAFDPVTFDTALVKTIREAARGLGYAHHDIVSGAGHDACWINRVAPSAMIFCPCVGGISHNEDEEITRDWAAAGANVLLLAALERAEISKSSKTNGGLYHVNRD